MSKPEEKEKHSRRLQKEQNAIKRQQKIAKTFGMNDHPYEGHYFSKMHALNCGNPKCFMCGNPRRTWKELTIQEQRQQQEMDIARMRHSNGVIEER